MLIQGASLAELARREMLAHPQQSNSAIAEVTGASQATVSRVRRELAGAGLVPHLPSSRVLFPGIPQLPARPGLDGALCATAADPGLWTSPRQTDRAEAIRVCERCPVMLACRAWALALPTTDSAIWGGMTTSERIAARRELARQQLAEAS